MPRKYETDGYCIKVEGLGIWSLDNLNAIFISYEHALERCGRIGSGIIGDGERREINCKSWPFDGASDGQISYKGHTHHFRHRNGVVELGRKGSNSTGIDWYEPETLEILREIVYERRGKSESYSSALDSFRRKEV